MTQEIKLVPVDDLHFDPKNPRFSSVAFNKENEREVIDLMIREEALIDLVVSIADQGFFQGEPLLVYRADDGRLIVAEGNRRLAAVKVLKTPQLTERPSFREIAETAKERTDSIPCLIFDRREDTLVYLGYKHITGNKKWGALEKAVYLSQLRDFIRMQEPDIPNEALHRSLARKVGSQAPVVGKTLAAYAIYQRGNDNGRESVFFGLQGVDRSQVDFSLIYTALGYENIYSFLGLSGSTDVDLSAFNEAHGKDFFRWLFKQDDFGQTAVSESRKLKELNKVLGNTAATAYFAKTNDLDAAYRLSAGPSDAFEGLIRTLKRDEKQLEILVHELRSDILNQQTDFRFSGHHVVDLADLGRAFRNLSDDIDNVIRRG